MKGAQVIEAPCNNAFERAEWRFCGCRAGACKHFAPAGASWPQRAAAQSER